MAREEEIRRIMEALVIADDKVIGEIMAARGVWGEGQSSRVQSGKSMKNLADLNRLEKGDGFYRIPGCKSEYKDHAKLLTKQLAEILKAYPESIIHREHDLTKECGLRPDAICLATKDDHGFCFILEVLVSETETYFESKINTWAGWSGATEYLSKLFGYRIPNFSIIPIRAGENISIPRKE
jgi:hypothetical protein